MSLLVVWSPAALTAAVIAGFGVGYWIVGRVAADPAWAAPGVSARALGLLVMVLAAAVGVVFYIGQATATYAEGDPAWPRVVSRLGLWLVYAVFLGIGTWLRVGGHIAARKRAARTQAAQELSK